MRFAHPNRYRVQQKPRKSHRCKHFSSPKVRHEEDTDALRTARFMADKYKEDFLYWRCGHCRHWHVGRAHDQEVEWFVKKFGAVLVPYLD